MAKCGNCKATGVSVLHVKDCYAAKDHGTLKTQVEVRTGDCTNCGVALELHPTYVSAGTDPACDLRQAEVTVVASRHWCAKCGVHKADHALKVTSRFLANHPHICDTLRDQVETMPLMPAMGFENWDQWVACVRATEAALQEVAEENETLATGNPAWDRVAKKRDETAEYLQWSACTIHGAHRGPECEKCKRPVRAVDPWSEVKALQERVAATLVREVKGKRVGYFALRVDGVVKFYRVKLMLGGRWDGRVFLDGQASSDFWSVKRPDSLVSIYTAYLADPEAAGMLYASELGSCCRCGRTLTDETSRAYGIGPECRRK